MATGTTERRARYAVQHHGQTFAAQAGITLRDKPSPLYRLLVLTTLLSARISADIAVRTATELSRAGLRTPEHMRDATWQHRVDVLGRGGYRRYDEKTATMLGENAQFLLDQYQGDLRRLRDRGRGDVHADIQTFRGIGPAGADIFCREVQAVWPQLAPFVDKLVLEGARAAGLPTDPGQLANLVPQDDVANLAAACVRAARSKERAAEIKAA